MDAYIKIVHNVTKFIRVAIEDRRVSIRNEINGNPIPYFVMLYQLNCRMEDSLL